MSASVWSPGTTPIADASGGVVKQVFTATGGQTLFTLTEFEYVVGTESLLVFQNGELLDPADFSETSTTSFTLDTGATLNDKVIAIGFPLVTADIEVVGVAAATIGASKFVRANAGASAFEGRSAAQVLSDIGAQASMTAASQAEMEAGAEAAIRSMSPLRVAQAIAALTPEPAVTFTRETFVATGQWTAPAGVTQILVTGQACGGGGGGSTAGGNGGDVTFKINAGATLLTLTGGVAGTAYSGGTPGTGGAGGGTGINQGNSGHNGQDKTDIGGGVNPASYANALGGAGGAGALGKLGSGGRGSDGTGLSGAAAGGGGAGEQCFQYPITVTPGQLYDITIGAAGTAGTTSGAGTASSVGETGFLMFTYRT